MGACPHSILPELLDHPCPVACYWESVEFPGPSLTSKIKGVGLEYTENFLPLRTKQRKEGREREEGEKEKGTSSLFTHRGWQREPAVCRPDKDVVLGSYTTQQKLTPSCLSLYVPGYVWTPASALS